jgi:zinc transporter 1/2/3
MGLIPVKSQKFKESPKILGVANAFSGGVFLAIALMHIMPEQTNSYCMLDDDNDDVDDPHSAYGPFGHGEDAEGCDKFPLPFLLMVLGYTLILTIDKVLFDSHEIFEHGGDDH